MANPHNEIIRLLPPVKLDSVSDPDQVILNKKFDAIDRMLNLNVNLDDITDGQTYGRVLKSELNDDGSIDESVLDHGSLNATSLLDDDHPQYLLIDGTRAMTGTLDMNGNEIDNVSVLGGQNSLTINGGTGTLQLESMGGQIINIQSGAGQIFFKAGASTKFSMISDDFLGETDGVQNLGSAGVSFGNIYGKSVIIGEDGFVGIGVGAERIVFDGTGGFVNILGVGGVGIGEASPADLLHIHAASDSALRIETSTEGAGGIARTKYYSPVSATAHPSVIAANTIALLLFEDDGVIEADDVGTYAWSNNSSVQFNAEHEPNHGNTSAFFDVSDIDQAIISASVTESILTIEFWFYWPTGHVANNAYIFSNGINLACQGNAGGIRLLAGGNWSATQAISDDTWYQVSCRRDAGTDWILRVQDVNGVLVGSERHTPGDSASANKVYTVGNNATLNTPCDGYVDEFRLSDVVRSSFPTLDTYSVTRTLQSWAGFDDENNRHEINSGNKELRLDSGTANIELLGNTNVTGALTASISLDIASSIAVTGILDEDNMVSDSAVKLSTQQSIKAYADTKIAKAFVDAKGDLISATANDTPAILGVGADGYRLEALAAAATGLAWVAPPTRMYVLSFRMMGTLIVTTEFDVSLPAIAGTIKRVSMCRASNGTGGSTVIDVNVNGASIFDVATKPTVTAAAGDNVVNSVTSFDAGEDAISTDDIISVDIDSKEAGGGPTGPQDLSVNVYIEPS